MKTCSFCWRDNEDGATVCCDCHKPLTPASPKRSSTSPQAGANRLFITVPSNQTPGRITSAGDSQPARDPAKEHRAEAYEDKGVIYRTLNEKQAEAIADKLRERPTPPPQTLPPHLAPNPLIAEKYPYPKKLCFWMFLCLVPLLAVLFAWRGGVTSDQYLYCGMLSVFASAAFSFCLFPVLKVPCYDVPKAYFRALRSGSLKSVPRSDGVFGMIQGAILFAFGVALIFLGAHLTEKFHLAVGFVALGTTASGLLLFVRGIGVAIFRSSAMGVVMGFFAFLVGILYFLYWLVRDWGLMHPSH